MTEREKLLASRQAEIDAAQALYDLADNESREMTDEELQSATDHLAKADEIQVQIEALDKREALKANLQTAGSWASQSQPKPKPNNPAAMTTPDPVVIDASQPNVVGGKAKGEFCHFGDFLGSVKHAALNPSDVDQRLYAAAPGLQTKVDSDGGFLIPVDQSQELIRRVYEMGQILSRVRNITLTGNTLTVPFVNETSRATGSRLGGVRGYWVEEAGSLTDSQMTFGQMELKLKKSAALGYVTEEMMADFAASGSLLMDAFAEELTFIVEDSIVRGTGSGQPQGILGSNSLVSITKETNQTADTIWGPNIVKMWARMWGRSRRNAVWLINQDVETQLWGLAIEGRHGTASTSADTIPLFFPAGSVMNNGEFGMLMGRPVIPVEYCSTLGDKGDILLTDLDQYLFAQKGGMQTASSIHVRFLTDEQTFRVTWRVDGQSMWSAALTPFKGSNTLSPHITLDARA